MNRDQILELKRTALEVRKDVVRMVGLSRASNLGSSLSVVDILTVLYFYGLSVKPQDPKWPERDRLVVGKSDVAPALYAILARKGFFEREELWSYRRLGAMLQGTLDPRRTAGVEAPGSGPGGIGLGIANGIAAACRMDHLPARVFCFVGNDELHEGSIWESAQSASKLRLGRLTAVAELHEQGPQGSGVEAMLTEAVAERFEAFGWETVICDGHRIEALADSFSQSAPAEGRPRAVIAKTRWGKGVASLENGTWQAFELPNRERVESALLELEKTGRRLLEEMDR